MKKQTSMGQLANIRRTHRKHSFYLCLQHGWPSTQAEVKTEAEAHLAETTLGPNPSAWVYDSGWVSCDVYILALLSPERVYF